MLMVQNCKSDEIEYQEFLKTHTLAKPGDKIRVIDGYWKDTVETVFESGNIKTMFGTIHGIAIHPGTAELIIIEEGKYEIVPDNTEFRVMNDLIRETLKKLMKKILKKQNACA
jgi:hypothetical protein